jgi:hypothetical protein
MRDSLDFSSFFSDSPKHPFLPSEGITIFSSSTFIHLDNVPDADVELVLKNQQIEETGVLELPDELFAFRIMLKKDGARQLNQWLTHHAERPLYLAVDGEWVASAPLEVVDEHTLDLNSLTFDAIYALAEKLGYDEQALTDLNQIRPRGKTNAHFTANQSVWKVTPNGNDITSVDLDDILEILKNRTAQLYGESVIVERAQSSLRVKSIISIDYDQLFRLIVTLGRVVIFTSPRQLESGKAIPFDVKKILTENHISGATYKDDVITLKLNDEGQQALSTVLNAASDTPLYLSIDGLLTTNQVLSHPDPATLKVEGLAPNDAIFTFAILDNDTLPTSLSISPISVDRSDAGYVGGYGQLWQVIAPPDSDLGPQDWEDIREILDNRFSTMFNNSTTIENEGGILTIVPDLSTDPEDLKALVIHRGESGIFFAPFPPQPASPIPAQARVIITSENITGAIFDTEEEETCLEIRFSALGAEQLKEELRSNPHARLWLAIDGETVTDHELVPEKGPVLQIRGLDKHDGRYITAFLDNDILPLPLSLEPVSVDSASTFTPADNQIWYVEADNESGSLVSIDIDECVNILNQRAAELMPDQVEFEADENWGIIIQFNNDTPINLDLLEQVITVPDQFPVPLRINVEEI